MARWARVSLAHAAMIRARPSTRTVAKTRCEWGWALGRSISGFSQQRVRRTTERLGLAVPRRWETKACRLPGSALRGDRDGQYPAHRDCAYGEPLPPARSVHLRALRNTPGQPGLVGTWAPRG